MAYLDMKARKANKMGAASKIHLLPCFKLQVTGFHCLGMMQFANDARGTVLQVSPQVLNAYPMLQPSSRN